MVNLASLLSGILFGTGLIISGMANPAKVIAFLNFAGPWDPSLAFVMAGAISVGLTGFYFAKKRKTTWLNIPMKMPAATKIDRRLIIGSSLFGIGWGLAGICPGPALITLSAGLAPTFIFVIAMLAGMMLYRWMSPS